MMDRLTSMAVFVKTADTGSFAAAALAFDISAQMAGRHVAELEARIGGQLLNRTTLRQNLTEIGSEFYRRCKQLLVDAEEAEAVASKLSTTPRGRLRVTARVTFGLFGLAPLVAPYLLHRPEVEIDLTLTDRYVDLIGEGFDAAIRLGPLVDSSLVARPLVPYRLVACAAPAYLGRHGTPSAPSELAGQECLSFA
jgi:DNA-binding transcriptional LysR family regulator